MFQPRDQRGRDRTPDPRTRQLKPRGVLAVPPGALAGKQRAHHGATRSLDEREAVASAPAEQEGQRAQDEVTEEGLHGEARREGRKCPGAVRSMTALTVPAVACRVSAPARPSSDRPPARRSPPLG